MSFAVFRSSAGSGKTFALVREYLRITLKDPSGFRHILAITFTNKAANELKQRVIQSLRDLSNPGSIRPGSSADTLRDQLQEDPLLKKTDLGSRASEALSLILHHYSEFSIGTIDSFSHRIIRAFAFDFGLPVAFRVELETEELLTSSVDLLLERAGTDHELTSLLVKFLESRMEDDKGWQIDTLLTGFAALLLDEEGQRRAEAWKKLSLDDFSAIAAQLHSRIRSFEEAFRKLGKDGTELLRSAGIPDSAFHQGKRGIPGYLAYLAEGRMDKLEPNSYVRDMLTGRKWAGKSAGPGESEAIARLQPRLEEIIRDAEARRKEGEADYHLYRLLSVHIYPMAVLHEIGRIMTAFKRERNMVHISEFNNRIAGVVLREPVPFIFERLGERYHHILIDEFQDTSRLQWQNIVPLMENALAGGYLNLVVGDGKQAIYRWRGGDVEQFAALPALPDSDTNPLIRQREQVLKTHHTEFPLNTNYRSRQEIIFFNNRFFSWLSGETASATERVYRDLEQQARQDRQGGFVELNFIPARQEGIGYPNLTIGRCETIIRKALEEGYAPRDIALLCRTRLQASRISNELIFRGVDVVSSESLLLDSSPDVRFVTGMIRFLTDPSDLINQAALLTYLHHRGLLASASVLPDDLYRQLAISRDPRQEFLHILEQATTPVPVEAWISLPLYDLCEAIIRQFSLNQTPNPYIRFFLDAVILFTGSVSHHITGFPDWWEQQRSILSVVIPDGVNAVRVMTVHKAKGLEFPVVICPFADERLRMTRNYLWVQLDPPPVPRFTMACIQPRKELEKTIYRDLYSEEREKSLLDLVNVLYVALTRPRDQLYILTRDPGDSISEIPSLPAFFAGFIRSLGLWETGRMTYSFGSTAGTPAETPPAEDTRVMNEMISEDWRSRIRIRPGAPEFWNLDQPGGKIEFGTRVHGILGSVATAEDLDPVLEAARLQGKIDQEQEQMIRELCRKVITHPLLAPCFRHGMQIRTEPGVLEPGGAQHRPDRVVFDDRQVTVLEYKTGKKMEDHRNQLLEYCRLLNQMGYPSVRGLLVYIRQEPEIEEVEEVQE